MKTQPNVMGSSPRRAGLGGGGPPAAIAHEPVIEDGVLADAGKAVLAVPAQQALPLAWRGQGLRARIVGRGHRPHAEPDLVANAGDEALEPASMRRCRRFDADQLRPAFGAPVDPG